MERRNLVRLLVVLAIGIPLLIEAATFAGLFGDRLLDDGADGTPTPPPDAVTVGDELLAETPPADTVTAAEVRSADGDRTFVLRVAVENDAQPGYELRLDALTTDAGTTVPGGGRTDRLGPGESATVTGRWSLPAGEGPRSVIVVATLTDEAGERRTVTRRVPVAVG